MTGTMGPAIMALPCSADRSTTLPRYTTTRPARWSASRVPTCGMNCTDEVFCCRPERRLQDSVLSCHQVPRLDSGGAPAWTVAVTADDGYDSAVKAGPGESR